MSDKKVKTAPGSTNDDAAGTRWSEKEVNLLMSLSRIVGNAPQYPNWASVATQFPGRSPSSCYQKYQKTKKRQSRHKY